MTSDNALLHCLRSIRVISLDGDMTLWDFRAVMRHALGCALDELRARRPLPAAALTIDRMIEIRDAVAAELTGKVVNLEMIRYEAFRRTVALSGGADDALAAHLNAVYLRHRFEDIELYPDVIPALDALGARYRLGLLSNGNSYPERCGLGGRFAFTLFAQDVGVAKPHPAIFAAALRAAGCRPEAMLHVGDSLTSDVQGALDAGLFAVWLNREGAPCPEDVRPDLEIGSLLDLVAAMEVR
jgi:putative hydrolase of the HAD superfamily